MSDEAYHYDDCELCERDAKSCTCPVGPQNDIDGGIKALIVYLDRGIGLQCMDCGEYLSEKNHES